MKNRVAHMCFLTSLLCTQTVSAAPTREEILKWIEQYAGATTLDEAPGRIGADRIDMLIPYLPPGVVEELRFPELDMEIIATETYLPHASYQEATAAFKGQASIGADGSLQNYKVGQPFSAAQIEQAGADEAGLMVAWNHIHR